MGRAQGNVGATSRESTTMNDKYRQLLIELGQKTGADLPLAEEALIIRVNDIPLHLELRDGSELINLHTMIDERLTLAYIPQNRLEVLLRMNSQHQELRGGWIGVDQERGVLNLYVSVPLATATSEMILSTLLNMYQIRQQLKPKLIALCLN